MIGVGGDVELDGDPSEAVADSGIDPEDPATVYVQSQEGALSRLDLNNGRSVSIRPRPQNTSLDGKPPAPLAAGAPQGGGRGGGFGQARFGRWHW